jgi:hypothetical protein
LYEVINEGGEKEWDGWVVDTVRQYERTHPHQHPIGITGHGAEWLESMLASPADWISPGSQDGYKDDPPAWDGKKVSLQKRVVLPARQAYSHSASAGRHTV